MTPGCTAELLKPESDDPFIILVTFTGAELAEPLRVANSYTQRLSQTDEGIVYGVVSGGDEFTFVPFTFSPPSDDDASSQQATLEFTDPEGTVFDAMLQLSAALLADVCYVLKSDPDTVEMALPQFKVGGFTFKGVSISIPLTVEGYDREPFPAGTQTPGRFPGLFS